MNTIAKYDFALEAPATPFKTVLLVELTIALVAKNLRGFWPARARRKVRNPWTNRFVWSKQLRHPCIVRAERLSESDILTDLQSGTLQAYASPKASGNLFRIPNGFWNEKFASISLSGVLHDLDGGKLFSKEFDGSSIYILDRCALDWLNYQKINEFDTNFPYTLRKGKPNLTKRMPADDVIRAQLMTLIEKGYDRDKAAKHIKTFTGFESVGNEHARRLLINRLARGRRPKKVGA